MRRLISITTALLAIAAASASAHHSPAAFDLTSQITIQGKVSRFDWTNPHVYIYVTTATAGRPTEWTIETDGTSLLTRSGWSRETLSVGSVVTVRANPDRNAAKSHALLISMALANGRVLTPRSNGTDGVSQAASLAGVWNGLRGFAGRKVGTIRPTPRGLAAVKAFTAAANPVTGCTPYATPFLTSLPYLNEIDIQKDRIFIRNEFLNPVAVAAVFRWPHFECCRRCGLFCGNRRIEELGDFERFDVGRRGCSRRTWRRRCGTRGRRDAWLRGDLQHAAAGGALGAGAGETVARKKVTTANAANGNRHR